MSETRTLEDMYDAEFYIENYILVRCDSDSRHTGGVAIYIRNDIQFKVISNCIRDRIWYLAIKITRGFMKGIYGVLYKSFQISKSVFLTSLDEWLEEVVDLNKNNIILGDFNIDVKVNNYYSDKLNILIRENGLNQIVTQYTRVTQHSKSLIDLLLTNCNKVQCQVIQNEKISDHYMICAKIMKTVVRRELEDYQMISRKSYTKAKLKQSLELRTFSNSEELNEMADDLIINLKSCVNNMIEKVTHASENDNPWYSDILYQLKHARDHSYNTAVYTNTTDAWNKYKRNRNKYKQMLRTKHSQYIQGKIMKNKYNPRGLWKVIKSLYKSKETKIFNIEIDNEVINYGMDLAQGLNQIFVKSIVDINRSIPDVNHLYIGAEIMSQNVFQFQEVNTDMVIDNIRNMNLNRGIDGINKNVLLDAMEHEQFSEKFVEIINKSLKEGRVPEQWKTSTIVPVPKVATPQKAEDLRPINMLPPYEVVLERVVKQQIISYINENQILVEQQSGFRQKYSCETALNLMLMNWKSEIEDNKIIVTVFLDFKRAFETIDRKILLQKLLKYGICGKELNWFEDYLRNRRQQVKVGNFTSDLILNELGVPQGSVLGPLLFVIYINDIVTIIEECKINMFADDTLITVAAATVEEAVEKINRDLDRLSGWLKYHKMALNISKTKFMITTLNRSVNINQNVIIDGKSIERVSVYKYLGVMIDDKLNFDHHLDYIAKKMNKKLGLFKRIKEKLPTHSKITFYKSLVSAHIDYCSSILFIMHDSQIDRLQKIQNKFMRVILRTQSRTHIVDMLDKLKWQSVNQRIHFNTIKFIYRIIKGDLPEYLERILVSNREIHNYNTRNTHYRIPLFTKAFSQRSLISKGITEYNKVQDHFKNCDLKMLPKAEFIKLLSYYIKDKISI